MNISSPNLTISSLVVNELKYQQEGDEVQYLENRLGYRRTFILM